MKKEVFENFLANAKIEKNKWTSLPEIDSIVLDDGRGIYSNWMHLRFYITDNEIFIVHGLSEPYGARLSTRFKYSYNFMEVSFDPSNVVLKSSYYGNFRYPKAGDFLVSSDGTGNVLSTSMITETDMFINSFSIKVSNPIKDTPTSKLNFYDPNEYNANLCIHGNIEEGIYMKFKENNGKHKKDFGKYHEVIKVKNIAEINLKLAVANKTYKVQ